MKARKKENTKEKKRFVLSKFRVFVINPSWFRLIRARISYVHTRHFFNHLN